MYDKKFDYIPFRINFINNILKNNNLNPMIDTNQIDTEAFINTNNSNDTEIVLNKKILNFNDVINKIGGKLIYIKSGTTGHTFRGFDPTDINAPNYAVKVVAYPKKDDYGKVSDISRPENAELMMLKVLSYFVVNNHTPHIVLPIGTFDTNIEPFLLLKKQGIVNNKKYSLFLKKYKNKELYNTVSILISEWANNSDLLEYVRSYKDNMTTLEWKVIFFQILSVLVVIQTKYPNFRHNDLKANNILIHNISKLKKNNLFKYQINGKIYIIPNIGFQIKIWDFDFACIKDIVNNSKVNAKWTSKINIDSTQNRYYDVHYFFNTLTKKGFYPELFDSDNVDQSIKEFIKRIVPDKYTNNTKISKRGRLLINDEYLTPEEIITKDVFFEEFRR